MRAMVKGTQSPFEPLRVPTFVHVVNQSVLRENKDCLETRRLHSKLKPRKRGVLEDCSATRTPGVRTTTVKGILSPFEPLRVTTAIKDCLETRRLHSKLKKQFSPERTRGVLEDCSATMRRLRSKLYDIIGKTSFNIFGGRKPCFIF